MRNDHVLKKLLFDLLTLPKGRGCRGVCGQTNRFHVAAFAFFFKFGMQHDCVLKKLNLDLLTPPPKSTQGVRHRPSIGNHV